MLFCCSEDDSELSENDAEAPAKGESLLNGDKNGLMINGSLSRDGEFGLFVKMKQKYNVLILYCV